MNPRLCTRFCSYSALLTFYSHVETLSTCHDCIHRTKAVRAVAQMCVHFRPTRALWTVGNWRQDLSGAARRCSTVPCHRQFTRTADIPSRQRLWSSTTDSLSVPAVPSDFLLLNVAPLYIHLYFLSLVNVGLYGTIYLRTLPPHRLCLHLSND